MDVVSRQSRRVAVAVPAFVVLLGSKLPTPEPSGKRCKPTRTSRGMLFELLPLSIGRPAWFIQNLRRNVELANVVKECRPAEPVAISIAEIHLLANEIAVRSDSFAMTTSQSIVAGN